MPSTILEDRYVRGVLPWFGSKRTMADTIVEELGPHHTYFEPFCGSMAVLIAKPKCRMETVNDLHGDLVNLARVIQHRQIGPQLYRRARRMWMAESEHKAAASRWKERGISPCPETPDLERALDFFFSSWVGRNGVTGTSRYNQGFAARYTPNGGHGSTRWQSAILSIPQWRRRFEEVTILNRDGFKLIEKISDEDGVAIYLDPPYIEKGAKYVHDFTADEHGKLAGLLQRFRRARVVVSYYEHPSLKQLYPGWTVRECPTTKAMMCDNGRRGDIGSVIAPEVLIINGPSYCEESSLFGATA